MIQNPILPGFCPDPSIIRVGEDYYIANSSFEWWPGVKIYHSKDLKHYEQLPSPLNRMSQLNMVGEGDSCGVWAPDISWNGEYFWLIYTDVKTGVANGAHGILVLTGETKPEDIPKSDVVPDAVFTGLKEMGELLGEK